MFKATIFLTLALSYLVISTAAAAQIEISGTLPAVTLADSNGVDLKSGQLIRDSGKIGIGPKSSPVLSYQVFATFGDAMDATPRYGRVYQTNCPNGVTSIPLGCYVEMHVVIGAKDYNFGWEFANPRISPLGAKLEQNTYGQNQSGWLMTDDKGIKWQFSNTGYNGNSSGTSTLGTIQSVKYPNGETLTYYANAIVSNMGYQLRFENFPGVNGSIYLINMAVDYCDPNASSCSGLTLNWPKLKIAQYVSGSGSNVTIRDSVTDAIGRTTTAISTDSLSVTSPGGGMNYKFKRGSFQNVTLCCGDAPTNVIAVAWYENALGRTNYNYTVDRFAKITASSSTRPGGGQISYNINLSAPYRSGDTAPSAYTTTITDEIGRTTTPSFGRQRSPNSYWPSELNLGGITYPEGDSVGIGRDSHGRLTTVTTTPKPNMGQGVSSTGSYTDCTDWTLCKGPDYTVDLRGNRTDYTYDPVSGLVLTKTDPADANGIRPQMRYSYQQLQAVYKNASGQLVQSGSPIWKLVSTLMCRTRSSCAGSVDEVRTAIGYDGNLLPTTETISADDGSVASTTIKTYDPVGNVISVDGPLPGTADTTRYFYDAARQLTGEIGPDPDGGGALPYPAKRYIYNPDGQVILVERGSATAQSDAGLSAMTVFDRVATTYDNVGRKSSESRAAGNTTYTVTQFSYDLDNRLICTAVRMNPTAYSSLPADACVLGTEGSQGPDRITKNVYDQAGQLLQVRKAVGTSLEQAYVTYSYTPNGKQEYVIDANGNRAKMVYDGFDRQWRWIFPSQTLPTAFNGATQATALGSAPAENAADYEEYGYDARGNRTSFRKRDGSVLNYTFDALNRMTVKTVPQRAGLPGSAARSVYYDYDLRGLQTYARFDSATGEGVTGAWDGLGRQTSSTLSMDGVARTVSYQYDADGNRTRVTLPDGNYTTYAYDALDRPLSILRSGSATLASYSYDAAGRRNGFNGGVNTTYGYDGIDRITSIANTLGNTTYNNSYGFSYNPAIQITQLTKSNNLFAFAGTYNVNRGYAVNGLNQYTAAGPASFAYDANGNLTSDGTATFLYDIENRLVSASGSRSVTLRYDPLGRLYESAGPSGTVRFLYDGDALVGEYDTGGNLLRRYVHGADGAADDPIAWYEGSAFGGSNERILRPDWQGSIALVSDNAGSQVFGVNTYDEYGIPGSNNIGRFQYTGQTWQPDLGMYYYKARIYSPTLGRFLQTDPIGYKDQINLYAYVANDPVNKTDPTGQWIDTIADIAFITADIADIASNGLTVTNGIALGADIVATAIPGVTGAGAGVRVVSRGVEAARAERAATRVERTASGRRVGDFTPSHRNTAKSENAAQNGGKMACTDCKKPLENVPSQKGVPTPSNQAQVHHNPPISQGGGRHSTPEVVCPKCHQERHRNQ